MKITVKEIFNALKTHYNDKEEPFYTRIQPVKNILTKEQRIRVEKWYRKNEVSVDGMTRIGSEKDLTVEPPKDSREAPELWKAENWRWYMTNLHLIGNKITELRSYVK